MAEDAARAAIAQKVLVWSQPEMDAVPVRRDLVYRAGAAGPLALDLYGPGPDRGLSPAPAVVIAMGYPDPEGRFRKMGWATSWARLLAASGVSAALYANERPSEDSTAVLNYLRGHAGTLGIDAGRVGVLASSGSVPVALGLAMSERLTCAVFLYGFMLDDEGASHVATAATTYGFANPTAGRAVADVPAALPLFVARAGRDEFAGLNESIDHFVRDALQANLPLVVVNHAQGAHAFDLVDDSGITRHVIHQAVAFLRFHLGV